MALMPWLAKPLWNRRPWLFSFQTIIPPVPMQGWLSAVSTQNIGPPLRLSSSPWRTSSSTPMPFSREFSSLAINTATTVFSSFGFRLPSSAMIVVTMAEWPRQSVVPLPYSLSPTRVNLKGSRVQDSGLAETTSRCDPTKEMQSVVAPGYVTIRLPLPSTYDTCSITRGPPLAVLSGSSTSRMCRIARSSVGTRSGGLFCRCLDSPMSFSRSCRKAASSHCTASIFHGVHTPGLVGAGV
mmetsp:Transcript_7438/g.21000  ORF Transcript_7438/g.21000 Transcript_7438/m.21000 type:complete len:239 (-) Transcript_7438:190-906(-)